MGDAADTQGFWRPVRESNPCRRREREATYCNSRELSGMDSTLPHFEGLNGYAYWTFNGRAPGLVMGLGFLLSLFAPQRRSETGRVRISKALL